MGNKEFYFCPAGEPGNDEVRFLDVAETKGKEVGKTFTSPSLKMRLRIRKVERTNSGRHVWAVPI